MTYHFGSLWTTTEHAQHQAAKVLKIVPKISSAIDKTTTAGFMSGLYNYYMYHISSFPIQPCQECKLFLILTGGLVNKQTEKIEEAGPGLYVHTTPNPKT